MDHHRPGRRAACGEWCPPRAASRGLRRSPGVRGADQELIIGTVIQRARLGRGAADARRRDRLGALLASVVAVDPSARTASRQRPETGYDWSQPDDVIREIASRGPDAGSVPVRHAGLGGQHDGHECERVRLPSFAPITTRLDTRSLASPARRCAATAPMGTSGSTTRAARIGRSTSGSSGTSRTCSLSGARMSTRSATRSWFGWRRERDPRRGPRCRGRARRALGRPLDVDEGEHPDLPAPASTPCPGSPRASRASPFIPTTHACAGVIKQISHGAHDRHRARRGRRSLDHGGRLGLGRLAQVGTGQDLQRAGATCCAGSSRG